MPRLAPMPVGGGEEAWQAYAQQLAQLWAADRIRLLGRWESVVIQRAETADCLDRERAAGRIR